MAFLGKITCVGLPRNVISRQLVVSFLQKVKYSDAIEHFTSDLVNKSKLTPGMSMKDDIALVQKTTKQLLKEINSIYDSVLCVDIRKLQEDQLYNLFINAIADNSRQDLNYLANECIKWSILPPRRVTVQILEYFEKNHQLDNLHKFYEFCLALDTRPHLLKMFKVKLYWTEGNTDKALGLLNEIHDVASRSSEDTTELIACKNLFVFLISDAVGKKSEAVLLKLIHLIETLEDVSLLEQVWNELFTSQWFSDQQLALNLFRRHACLRLRLSVQTNYVTFLLLREHNTDAVYRLVELLLSHEMMYECQKVLGLLFDYQCKYPCDQYVSLLLEKEN